MENISTIKINAVGLDERSLKTLSFFFNKFCNGECELAEEDKAEVFLINMDNIDAEKDYKRLNTQESTSKLILTAIKSLDDNGHYFLRKPMIASHLLSILKDIRDKSKGENTVDLEPSDDLESHHSTGHAAQLLNEQEITTFVGDAEDVNLRRINELDTIFFDASDYFLGFLRQAYQLAKQDKATIRITGLWRPVTIFPNDDQVYVDLSDRQLQSISVVSLQSQESKIEIEVVDSTQAIKECENIDRFQSLDLFVWKIALWTSRGRLPKGISIDSPVYLSAWPNFTRLITTPYALRITAFWIAHPRTIMNLTEHLPIPQRYIFSFFTASYMTSLSGLANRASDTLILPSQIQPSVQQGFFSRIMSKLYSRRL